MPRMICWPWLPASAGLMPSERPSAVCVGLGVTTGGAAGLLLGLGAGGASEVGGPGGMPVPLVGAAAGGRLGAAAAAELAALAQVPAGTGHAAGDI